MSFNHPYLYELLSEKDQWEGKELTVRGYLLVDKEGLTLLSVQPDVPSCCRGKVPCLALFPPVEGYAGELVEVQGVLRKGDPWLLEGVIKKDAAYSNPPALAVAFALGIVLWGGYRVVRWISGSSFPKK